MNRHISIMIFILIFVSGVILFIYRKDFEFAKNSEASEAKEIQENMANSSESTQHTGESTAQHSDLQINIANQTQHNSIEIQRSDITTQDGGGSENVTPVPFVNSMSDYEKKLVDVAAKHIDADNTIPYNIIPQLETKGKHTIVFWPIPPDELTGPGPGRVAAVFFIKGTLEIDYVIGAH